MDMLEFKKMFMEVSQMCKYEDCTKSGAADIMGSVYCSEHIGVMDFVWEQALGHHEKESSIKNKT